MARKKKINDYGTGIPYHEVEALARVLLPEILAFFESEEGQREYAEWKKPIDHAKDKMRIVFNSPHFLLTTCHFPAVVVG